MRYFLLLALPLLCGSGSVAAEDAVPTWAGDVRPILEKHCTGCHNADESEGGLRMHTYAELMKGGKHGAAIAAGTATASRLYQMASGALEPVMPPDGLDQASEEELKTIAAWIDGGAKGPDGAEPPRTLSVPELAAADTKAKPITALAWSPDGECLAVAKYGRIFLQFEAEAGLTPDFHLSNGAILPGKVTSLEFSKDGKRLIAATGTTGLSGTAILYELNRRALIPFRELARYKGATDILYAARLSPDGKTIATGGYDGVIRIYETQTRKLLHELSGHNGAVYDLAFTPDGTRLVSASADETCKVWRVDTGVRLDTLGQPQAEQFLVRVTSDGRFVIAAGSDNRIRMWRLVSKEKPRINPLVHARLAHEGGITALALSRDSKRLVSFADDRSARLWELRTLKPLADLPPTSDVAADAVTSAGAEGYFVGLLDGSFQRHSFAIPGSVSEETFVPITARLVDSAEPMQTTAEVEPNNGPSEAQAVTLPTTINGRIHSEDADATNDADYFRFTAQAGEQWVIDVNAARSKSPLDSVIEVLDSEGQPVVRTLLQAVRDSYFTFRGKDSNTSDDFRVFNWQEMELNEFLYANGEVVKLWHYPRGPDSGFKVYPGFGSRHNFFDTTPLSHPLQEPIYIVKPLPPGAQVIPNGLPVFKVHYINDDDAKRSAGRDSKLTFTAPADGEYLVKLTDVRGESGEKHTYTLTIRPRKPDFRVRLSGNKPSLAKGSAAEFELRVDRIDDFDGPITVAFENLPEGISIPDPVVIEEGQIRAYGVVIADPALEAAPSDEAMQQITATAVAIVNGEEVRHTLPKPFASLSLMEKPPVLVSLHPDPNSSAAKETDADPWVLEVRPGETVSAVVRIDRNGNKSPISFGKDDSGRNLPHGVYVDNIGLNGLLIVPSSSERTFYITASPIAEPTERLFHLKVGGNGNQASRPVLLRVLPRE